MMKPQQIQSLERLPKTFPALQERMEAIRSHDQKQPLVSRSPLENPPVVETDDSFFLL